LTYEDRLRHFEEGERLCPVCKKSLPAHDTWPGFHFQFCGSPDCAAKIERSRYIGPNERKCAGPGCDNFVPAGFYHPKASFLTCCGKCWIRRRTKGNRLLSCGCGCGQEFLGKAERKPIDGKYFLSARHYGNYLHAKYVTETSGVFRDLVVEYLEGFAILHYKEQQTARRALGPFFRFLNEEGISSLNDVEPKTITKYLAWAKKSGRRGHNLPVSYISTFFKWAIAEGHRKGGNPVVPLIHRTRVPKRKPRPLADNDLEFTWELLNERGNARLRLASAIAEESGLRIGEICRIRLQDVDTVRRQLFVRLPNKGNEERWACFSDKTLLYYDEWMNERNPGCGHDHLLHNMRGNPCRTALSSLV
jgi:integrase